MDVLKRLSRGGGAITVNDDGRIIEVQRLALAAVARWASGCLGHDELEANIYQRRVLAAFEGGESAEHVVSEIGTQVEMGGKPSLASFASLIFQQAMDNMAAPAGARPAGQGGSLGTR